MLICFIYSGSDRSRPLEIHRDDRDGPFYPHVAELSSEKSYRFFAGKLTDVSPSSSLPASHPVSSLNAADWSFPEGEADGSWIALKHDRERNILSVAADAFNVQRWFYTRQGERWCVSNSLRYLFRFAPGLEIEWQAVPYMLHHGYLPRRLTPLKDVFELDPGETLTIEHRSGRVTRRADLPVHRRPVQAYDDYALPVAEAICRAVTRDTKDLPTILLPISGGMDSRFLLGCALSVLPREKIGTVTFGLPSSLDLKLGTRLARKLGVSNFPLSMDTRPLGEILCDNFATAEGMYWTVPDYPVASFQQAVPPQSYILSGYIGDPVWGSKEGKGSPTELVDGKEQNVIRLLRSSGSVVAWESVEPLLALPKRDPLNLEREVLDLPGRTMQERYDFWYFGTHTTNRTHYAVTPARSRAFFLMPFIHRRVLDAAFALPVEERMNRKAYLAAMKLRFPELYRFPTKRNFGFPVEQSGGLDMLTARVWRKTWSTLDDALGPPLHKIIYRHPKFNYDHPRELAASRHQPDVLAALEALKTAPTLNPKALDRMRDAYLNGKFDSLLLRGLLTVHQWMHHYGAKS